MSLLLWGRTHLRYKKVAIDKETLLITARICITYEITYLVLSAVVHSLPAAVFAL